MVCVKYKITLCYITNLIDISLTRNTVIETKVKSVFSSTYVKFKRRIRALILKTCTKLFFKYSLSFTYQAN